MTDDVAVGSLFSGYGGLDRAVETYYGARTAWHAEWDAAPARVLGIRWPGVPNHVDVTQINWRRVEPVRIMCGGFPCQDLSIAGRRRGLTEGTRSGLWSYFAEGIDVLRPERVVIENVRGLLSAKAHRTVERGPAGLGDDRSGPVLRALGAVLGDLADMGYDARWGSVRAADAGAPHLRTRIFIVAAPTDPGRNGTERLGGSGVLAGETRLPRDADGSAADLRRDAALDRPQDAPDSDDRERERQRSPLGRPTAAPRDSQGGDGGATPPDPRGEALRVGPGLRPDDEGGLGGPRPDHGPRAARWGEYAAAVDRWERILGRPAPEPLIPGARRGTRLNPAFAEWMMGLPEWYLTHPDIGITARQQVKMLGNGVVPQQALLALSLLDPAYDPAP